MPRLLLARSEGSPVRTAQPARFAVSLQPASDRSRRVRGDTDSEEPLTELVVAPSPWVARAFDEIGLGERAVPGDDHSSADRGVLLASARMGAHGMHVHPSDDVTIDYYAAGEGPAVVLVHGITESRRTWDPLFPMFLQAGYRVILIDLRGHGDSSKVAPYDLATMAGDVGAVLTAEGLDDALLVGHSLGGAVVSAYAAGGPCRGVVNVDQPLLLSGFKAMLADLEPALKGSTEEFDGAISAIFDGMAGPLAGHERQRVDTLRNGDQDVVLGVWDLVFTASADELDAVVDGVVGSISAPYLSLHGIDPGPEYTEWLTSKLPSATVEVWADQGHYPHLIEPQRFVERVRAFDPAV